MDRPLAPLLGRVARQDRAALRELYDATVERLLAVATRLLDDRGAAEDVVQEVFVAVWTRADQLPELREHPLAWLTTMVRHRAIDQLRRRRPEVPLQWQDADGEEHAVDLPDPEANPARRLMEAQSDQRLRDCLGRLEPEPRDAVLLAYFEGLTHGELAERLGKPLGTVKAWVRRSLGRLRDCLGDLEALA
ncbi:RNA polymerase sigma factor [Piscinibacter sakaiensis]|uniref:RNA polymerase sigma factor n=2 Tax=Piscinibacter sakaiensis TaxID=1547922 RepID=A0A0K8P007_PISS1|nr:sigma-70 family RNA polymerase sigma factor [Piscinibacter sakaiensis]GAP35966.1 RNA polymerase sigma factor [Piscinibacter sakaiensis]